MEDKNFDDVAEADVIVKYINSRFKKGLNTNIFVIGLSGTGKSSTTIRIPELCMAQRPTENLKLYIVDSLLSLIEAIKQAKHGDFIGIEEVSVLFPSRRSMSSENVAVGKIFDTIRKKKLCIIANAPLFTSVDKHIKAMMQVLIQTMKVYSSYGVVVSKFFRLQTDPSSGKIYKHTMLRDHKDIKKMITRMPNSETWAKYESDKDNFMEVLYERLKQEALKKEGRKKEVLQPKVRDLTQRELEVHTLRNVKGLKTEEVAKKLGISTRRVNEILQNILKKGEIVKEMPKKNLPMPLQTPLT